MKWGLSSGTPADSYYEVRSDCTDDVPKSKFKIKAGKTLSARKWHAAFSPDGCLDIASVLSRIQRGGVHPTVRGEVWEFLLGCFDPRSTFDEREEIRQIRRYLLPCGLLRYTFYLLRGKRLDKSGSLNFERETN